MFRVRGDTVEIWPAYWKDTAIRVEFFGDEIDRISEINVVTGTPIRRLNNIAHLARHPLCHPEGEDGSGHYRTSTRRWMSGSGSSRNRARLIEAQRIRQRTMYDVEMMQEIGYCSGIENYSRVIDGRARSAPRPTRCWTTSPRIFCSLSTSPTSPCPRCGPCTTATGPARPRWWTTASGSPARYDNRPLKFEEFEQRLNQVDLRLRHPRQVRAGALRPDRGAGHPPHRPAGSQSGGAARSKVRSTT